jgi:chromosome partitioning protein
MGCVVSIINLKGGVGKSTLTMLIAEYLVFKSLKKVLLIDMDAQGNLTYCMVPEDDIQTQRKNQRTIFHLLKTALEGGAVRIDDYITQPPLIVSNIERSSLPKNMIPGTSQLHMIISLPDVATLDDRLIQLWEENKPIPSGLRQSLRQAIKPVKNSYDFVLIDCPPGLSLFSSTALFASDYFVSPVIPEPLSMQGVELVQMRASELNRRGAKIEFRGVVLNIVKHYRRTHQRMSKYFYEGEGAEMLRPFKWWVPDSELIRKLGEYDMEWLTPTGRIDQFSPKFGSIEGKYGASATPLTNPSEGPLSRIEEEGKHYRLVERLERLVDEFQDRCG